MASQAAVITWRENIKRRMVQAMGGKCAICAYDRCYEALEFHHKNPLEKDFSLSQCAANPKSWAKIVIELKKCVLLCANCHREVHSGVAVVPDDSATFDPIWEDYKTLERAGLTARCAFCGSPKRPEAKHCSLRCASLRRERFAWDDYDLSELLRQNNKSFVAAQIGVSLAGLQKHLLTVKKCQRCGEPSSKNNERFCSVECASKSRRKIDWDQVDLFDLRKTMSKLAIAKSLGVSDVAVAKRLKSLAKNGC